MIVPDPHQGTQNQRLYEPYLDYWAVATGPGALKQRTCCVRGSGMGCIAYYWRFMSQPAYHSYSAQSYVISLSFCALSLPEHHLRLTSFRVRGVGKLLSPRWDARYLGAFSCRSPLLTNSASANWSRILQTCTLTSWWRVCWSPSTCYGPYDTCSSCVGSGKPANRAIMQGTIQAWSQI